MKNAIIVQDVDISPILRADLADSTKRKYSREIQALHAAGINPGNHRALAEYAAGLCASRRAFLKSALHLMTKDIELSLKAGATPDNLGGTQAALYRIEAIRESITVTQPKGDKSHLWLTQSQVTDIVSICAGDLEGRRDYVVLSVLFGAGLRRDELARLTFSQLHKQNAKSGKARDVLEVKGKGAKDRVIPISAELKSVLDDWRLVVSGGRVARRIRKNDKIDASLSAAGIFNIVRKYGILGGFPELAPHDCRRSYAQIAYNSGVPITQISRLLGHSTVAITQRYLDLSLDLDITASDYVLLNYSNRKDGVTDG